MNTKHQAAQQADQNTTNQDTPSISDTSIATIIEAHDKNADKTIHMPASHNVSMIHVVTKRDTADDEYEEEQ